MNTKKSAAVLFGVVFLMTFGGHSNITVIDQGSLENEGLSWTLAAKFFGGGGAIISASAAPPMRGDGAPNIATCIDFRCDPSLGPVCGIDSSGIPRTFENRCIADLAYCREGRYYAVVKDGEC